MDDGSSNPYAPPQSGNPVTASGGDCYRRGKLLIVPRESAPYVPNDSCIKCGQPATKLLPRNFYWHHPLLYILIFAYLLPYLLVAIIVRKQMRITVGLCVRHQAVRRWWIASAWLLLLLSIGFKYQSFSTRGEFSIWFLLGGLGCLLLSLITACIASNLTIRPRRITETEGHFAGAGEGYLQQYPER